MPRVVQVHGDAIPPLDTVVLERAGETQRRVE